jgi:hypothetical protein
VQYKHRMMATQHTTFFMRLLYSSADTYEVRHYTFFFRWKSSETSSTRSVIVMLCSLIDARRRFREIYHLYFRGRRIIQTIKKRLQPTYLWFVSFLTFRSWTCRRYVPPSVGFHRTRHYNTEDFSFQSHRCKNLLKSTNTSCDWLFLENRVYRKSSKYTI